MNATSGRNTVYSSFDCLLYGIAKDLAFPPDFNDAPQLLLNLICGALVGYGSSFGENLPRVLVAEQ